MTRIFFTFYIACLLFLTGCSNKSELPGNPVLFNNGAYPWVTEYKGTYYYTMQLEKPHIALYSATNLADLGKADSVVVWKPQNDAMHNFWSPEIHRINNKWYIYFEADNGVNTDNHQIYVLENPSDNPLKGSWTLHGPVITNQEWNFGIHPSTFTVKGRQYLVWSGWQHRRAEEETQCIFIAEMENPWTLKSERVMLSLPECEWERQWINPDGSRSAYPIFVNENPEGFVSPDGKKVIVAYSASGIWTAYNSLGLLYASTSSDLLNPASWTKLRDPQFVATPESGIFGTSNISIVTGPDNKPMMLYQAKELRNGISYSHIRMKPISWNSDGLPEFGQP